jgi:hypothetical protein
MRASIGALSPGRYGLLRNPTLTRQQRAVR